MILSDIFQFHFGKYSFFVQSSEQILQEFFKRTHDEYPLWSFYELQIFNLQRNGLLRYLSENSHGDFIMLSRRILSHVFTEFLLGFLRKIIPGINSYCWTNFSCNFSGFLIPPFFVFQRISIILLRISWKTPPRTHSKWILIVWSCFQVWNIIQLFLYN